MENQESKTQNCKVYEEKIEILKSMTMWGEIQLKNLGKNIIVY